MASSVPSLPPPSEKQAYCDISALEGGLIHMPCHMFVTTAPEDEKKVVPSLSFLVTHRNSQRRIVFDLGIRSDIENYPEFTRRRLSDVFNAGVPCDVPTALAKGGLKPEDITHVCLSHCHWDHTGNPSLFSKAQFIVGAEAATLFQPGYPEDPKSVFPSDLLPKGRTEYFDTTTEKWRPIGPFPRALDYFGDGSAYFIDAPGHLAGHMNLLARTSPDGGWIYLAGDAAHDWRLVRGEGDIAMYPTPEGALTCIHQNKEAAQATIKRIADVLTLPRVRVVLAHDGEWYHKNKDGDAFWPGKIPSL
ncbi:Metallo-hydrolase/oxidoreductase [Fomitiporia mediterranea MF3/22]|uniref:Metallo-hydrolase/oxidoreductase n=1 Tax=Fomitiporia mediterranea (strain MF3/22) TaxID=694068 RepID=UPI0004408081|nr:Metallo-hydrolase/oxidoreductase [Fomitiporia mediterranea MF3/22]EJD06986.1 Metallo-hydrolase/oxidoreductase [Fomitiporia mediterranea MF3/22]